MLIPVKYTYLILDRKLVANATREQLITACRQVFDELGLRIHKEDTSLLVHWPGGLGRATNIAAALTVQPVSLYSVTFESLGLPGVTGFGVRVRLFYGRWSSTGQQRAQAKINAFAAKLGAVIAEHGIRVIDRKDFDQQAATPPPVPR